MHVPFYALHTFPSHDAATRVANGQLYENTFFPPLPKCSTNVVARVMEVAESAVKKPAGGGCGRVAFRAGDGSALVSASAYFMDNAFRLFYFILLWRRITGCTVPRTGRVYATAFCA